MKFKKLIVSGMTLMMIFQAGSILPTNTQVIQNVSAKKIVKPSKAVFRTTSITTTQLGVTYNANNAKNIKLLIKDMEKLINGVIVQQLLKLILLMA